MAEFSMKIAGHVARVQSLFDSTPHFFAKYLTDEPVEFSIRVKPEDLQFEQDFLLQEALEEGFRPRVFTDPFLDRAAIQRQFAHHLLPRQVLLLHGSAIAADDRGYLFIARSGTGKSTHTRLWRQLLADRAVMINDDKPFVHHREECFFLCGSPWSGKHGLDSNLSVPLAGICLLERGQENRIAPLDAQLGLQVLLQHSCPPLPPQLQETFHQLMKQLATSVPLWKMECNKDPMAAQVAFEAMSHT